MARRYLSVTAATKAMIDLGFRVRTGRINGITQNRDFRMVPIMIGGERWRTDLVISSPEAEAQFRKDISSFISLTRRYGHEWTVEEKLYGLSIHS